MRFIEMSGKTLFKLISEPEMTALHAAGITDHCLVRVNEQGDVEVRRRGGWDVVGGLLGDFEHRVREATGLDWA